MLGVAMESRSDMRKLRVGGGDLRPVTNPRTCAGSLPSVSLSSLPSAIVDHRVTARVGGRLAIIRFDLVATERLPIGTNQALRAPEHSRAHMERLVSGAHCPGRGTPPTD